MDIIFGAVDAKQRQAEIEAEERAIEQDFGSPGELRGAAREGSSGGEGEKEVEDGETLLEHLVKFTDGACAFVFCLGDREREGERDAC